MKTSVIALVIICAAAVAGTIVYQKKHKVTPVPVPVVESLPQPQSSPQAQPEMTTVSNPKPPESKPEVAPAAAPNSALEYMKPVAATVPHSKAVDTLVSTQTSFNDRQALFKKLKKIGELDAAIAELKQRAAADPNDAMTQIALGEAIMNKFPVQDYNEQAMLGLQINQSFDAALKLDPQNWEAQYSKADSLSHWPAELNTGPEVIQQLSSLIDQQETMTLQPQFVNSYVVLGDEYQKLGQADKAAATWQLGLQKFPNDSTLQRRLANPTAR